MELNNRRGISLTIKKTTLCALLVVIILNIPGFLIDITTIYHIEHAYTLGDFATLSYSFTVFELILCIWGLCCYNKELGTVNIYPILVIILFKDILIFLQDGISPISLNSWEMYLSPLIGMSCCAIAAHYLSDENGIDRFMDWLIIANFTYQILFLITGRVDSSGRVAVMSQGFGSIGYMCALHILYCLIVREKDKKTIILLIISLVSIILSGSRFSLLVVMLGVLFFSGYIFRSSSRNVRRLITTSIILLTVVMIYIMLNPSLQEKYSILSRMTGLFQGGVANNISNDESFLQRIESIGIGFMIMKEFPLGISNSYIDLQGKTIGFGFFSFPHSTIQCYYLMWGPVFIFCIYWIAKRIIRAQRLHIRGIKYFLLLLLVIFAIYGGIETAPKVYTYMFCLLSAINKKLNVDIGKN